MDGFIIEGGRRLEGKVTVGGAKNAVLPIFAAAILGDGPSTIRNVPDLRDVRTMARVLGTLGCKVEGKDESTFVIDPTGVDCFEAPYDLVKTMRASFIVLGPLVARHGRARVSLPGGCAIGVRQVDFHLRGLRALGAVVDLGHGYVEARADQLRGASIYLDFPSVGATENLMLAASLAEGTTVIQNAAMEPEVVDLARFLSSMGASIVGAGTGEIVVEGRTSLSGCDHVVIGDRIEAGTYLLAGAITRGDVTVEGVDPVHLDAVCAKLRQTGAVIETFEGGVRVVAGEKVKPVNVTTLPHPGFPTDLQAPMMSYLTLAEGSSSITETIFENRFLHVAELKRMGASITKTTPSSAIVSGPNRLEGAPVMASDLRAGAALVVAALAAEDETRISRIYHVDRGYGDLEAKLTSLGARIRRYVPS